MAAGDSVLVRRHGEHVILKVDGVRLTEQDRPQHGSSQADMAATPGVENTGTITASRNGGAGRGDMYSLAVRNSGTIRGDKGDVTVAAVDGLVHNTATGSISADAKR